MDLAQERTERPHKDMSVKAEVWDKDPRRRRNCHLPFIESLVLDTFLHMYTAIWWACVANTSRYIFSIAVGYSNTETFASPTNHSLHRSVFCSWDPRVHESMNSCVQEACAFMIRTPQKTPEHFPCGAWCSGKDLKEAADLGHPKNSAILGSCLFCSAYNLLL